jgi:hypothetical protein
MTDRLQESFDTMLSNWNRMQASDLDEAGDDADRFQTSFYRFIDELRDYLHTLSQRPQTLVAALALPEITALSDQLPAPLLLNFETELELIVEQITREEDKHFDT